MPKTAEEKREYLKQWRLQNKERMKAQARRYYEEHKAEIKKQAKDWKQNNVERKRELNTQWKQANPEKSHRSNMIVAWKSRGIIHDDYDALYDEYTASTNCEECGIPYGKWGDGTATFKCCDHDHETGKFRNFLCNRCNIQRR